MAKEIGERVTEIDFQYKTGNPSAASEKYNELASYIDDQRDVMIGDFRTRGDIDEILGGNAIGANGDPTSSVIGVVVVYVGVEIYALS